MNESEGTMNGDTININALDKLLTEDKCSFIVITEQLMPAGGMHTSVAAAQYPAAQGTNPDRFLGGANLVPKDGGFDVIIDSIASSANRRDEYMNREGNEHLNRLMPEVFVQIGDSQNHISEAPHRSADASLPLNEQLGAMINGAIKDWVAGNAAPLAKFDPSSIIGGCWHSRGDSGVKMSRMVSGQITGIDAIPEPSMTVYTGSLGAKALNHDLGDSDEISRTGHGMVPSVGKPTNKVRVSSIIATTNLSLDPIRLLRARKRPLSRRGRTEEEKQEDLRLQRYILGLALVKALVPPPSVLRSGCELIQVESGDAFEVSLKCRRRSDIEGQEGMIEFVKTKINLDWAVKYCAMARDAFGVQDFEDPFHIDIGSITNSASAPGKEKGKKRVKKGQIVAETVTPPTEVEG